MEDDGGEGEVGAQEVGGLPEARDAESLRSGWGAGH